MGRKLKFPLQVRSTLRRVCKNGRSKLWTLMVVTARHSNSLVTKPWYKSWILAWHGTDDTNVIPIFPVIYDQLSINTNDRKQSYPFWPTYSV